MDQLGPKAGSGCARVTKSSRGRATRASDRGEEIGRANKTGGGRLRLKAVSYTPDCWSVALAWIVLDKVYVR